MATYQTALRGVSYSDAYAEAMASAGVDDLVLYLLEIRHADLVAPIRLVINDTNVTAKLEADAPEDGGAWVEHTAIAFGLQLPEESDTNAAPAAQFWIDGVSSLVASALEVTAESLEPVSLTVRTYMSTDLTAPAVLPPLALELTSLQINETRVTAAAAYADFGNTRFPKKTFTAAEYPGLQAR